MMTMDARKRKNRVFRPIVAILSWWRRRQFQYLVEVETREDPLIRDSNESVPPREQHEVANGNPELQEQDTIKKSLALYLNDHSASTSQSYPFQRSSTANSYQGSIESIDSVMDSYWDPDDTASQKTHLASNSHGDTYLMEHLNFMSVSTQPQEVNLVYDE